MTGVKRLARRIATIATMAAMGVAIAAPHAAAQPSPSSPPSPPVSPRLIADAIYYNGAIVTMDDAAPEAQAVALAGTKILAVGSNDTVLMHRGSSTKVTDLKGKTIIPGFIDAH